MAKKYKAKTAAEIHAEIADKFIEMLEAGVVPWRKPWTVLGEPANLISGKPYRGINPIILGLCPYNSPYWLTYKQAQELGGHVKKGEKSTMIVFFKRIGIEDKEQTDKEGNPLKKFIPLLKCIRVFNVEQCENLKHKRLDEYEAKVEEFKNRAKNDQGVIEQAEAIIKTMPNCPPIVEIGDRAFYQPSTDSITMPPKHLFEELVEFYQTLFHEMIHSTGHEKRLSREGVTNLSFFGSHRYGKEELIAELGASMLSHEAGIVNEKMIENSAAYLGSWIKTIREDPSIIIGAASKAQAAVDYVLDREAPVYEDDKEREVA